MAGFFLVSISLRNKQGVKTETEMRPVVPHPGNLFHGGGVEHEHERAVFYDVVASRDDHTVVFGRRVWRGNEPHADDAIRTYDVGKDELRGGC